MRTVLGSIAAPLVGLHFLLAALPSAAQENGSWPIPGKNFAGFRYSELDQINTENVAELKVAWTFSLGVLRGQEGAPIVAEHTMFVVTPYPNILYAALPAPGDLSALEDQQMAGLIMWVPAGLVYVAAALGLCAAVLRGDGSGRQIGTIGEHVAASGGSSR